MKKFAVFSGFLGSGKTTAMMALTKYYTDRHGKAAMISNDLGAGVTLADYRLAKLSGVLSSEITDECICFCHGVLAEHLNRFYGEGCDLVVSDIPGFGVGALEHVYRGMSRSFPGEFEMAPFMVLIEPRSVELLRSGNDADTARILRAQLVEADLIVLNKCDLISADEAEEYRAWLKENYPQTDVLLISAAREEGLEELSLALKNGTASMREPDLDLEDKALGDAMDRLTEYYIQYHAEVCCNTFDGTDYLKDIALRVQAALKEGGFEVPHLKLLAWEPEGDFGKVDLLGTDRPVEITRRFERPCTGIAVVLNANAVCPAAELDRVMTQAVEESSKVYQLEIKIFKKQCFNLGE